VRGRFPGRGTLDSGPFVGLVWRGIVQNDGSDSVRYALFTESQGPSRELSKMAKDQGEAPKPPVTIQDVARAAGVSTSTVSNLLNGRDGRMRPGTSRRVREAILELDYQPSNVARQLRTGQGRMLGLIVPSVANPFWADMAHVFEAEALRNGYQVTLCNSERDPDRECAYVEDLWTSGVRTVILGSSLPSLSHLTAAIRRGLRLIAFDRETVEGEDPSVISVSIDNRLGGFIATRHLLLLGHRRIGFVTGPVETISRRQRLAGYQQAIHEAGVPFAKELIWEGHEPGGYGDIESAKLGKKGVTALLDLPDPPTAIVTINDIYAIGVMAGVRERGLTVPADISVVGFDDIVLASLVDPPLTTVHQPLAEMARFAVDVIRGASPDTPSSLVVVPRLIVRESAGAPWSASTVQGAGLRRPAKPSPEAHRQDCRAASRFP
jgi:DNA-binding LacI/PurR family transcriptional regulator